MAQHPDLTTSWWDHDKYPVITLRPIAFPAPVLPVLLSFAFVFYQTFPGYENGNRRIAPAQQLPPNAADQPRQRRKNVGNVQQNAPELERYAGHALSFIHSVVNQKTISRPPSRQIAGTDTNLKPDYYKPSNEELRHLCMAEAAALVIGAFFFRRSASKVQGLLAALGFLCFAYSQPDQLADFCLVVLLALPSALQFGGGRPILSEWMGSILLLGLACNEILADDSPLRRYKLRDLEVWRFAPLLACISIVKISRKLRDPRAAGRSRLSVAWESLLEGN